MPMLTSRGPYFLSVRSTYPSVLYSTLAHRPYIDYLDSANATSACVTPVFQEVAVIVRELTWALKGLHLAGCGCTSDIITLIAIHLKVVIIPASVSLLRSFSSAIDYLRMR